MKMSVTAKTWLPLLSSVSRPVVPGSFGPLRAAFHGPVVRGRVVSLSILAALTLCGCTVTHALKGGRAFTGRTTGGAVSQVLLQGENPSVPSRQTQESIKVRLLFRKLFPRKRTDDQFVTALAKASRII